MSRRSGAEMGKCWEGYVYLVLFRTLYSLTHLDQPELFLCINNFVNIRPPNFFVHVYPLQSPLLAGWLPKDSWAVLYQAG